MATPTEEEDLCIVCFEGEAPPATCACRNAHLHTECMRQMLQKTNRIHCAVCLAPYTGIQVNSFTKRRCHRLYIVATMTYVLSCLFVFLCVWVAVNVTSYCCALIVGTSITVGVCAAMSFFVAMYLTRHVVRNRIRCCVEDVRVTHVVSVPNA